MVVSFRLPAVRTAESFCPLPWVAMCPLDVRPPRERPIAWSGSSMPSFCNLTGPPVRRGRVAPCWRRRTILESIEATQSRSPKVSARVWTCSSTFVHVPSLAQRSKFLSTEFQFPKCAGRSRHGAPVRNFHAVPSTIRRRFATGRTLPFYAGNRGPITDHTSSGPESVVHHPATATRPQWGLVTHPRTLQLLTLRRQARRLSPAAAKLQGVQLPRCATEDHVLVGRREIR